VLNVHLINLILDDNVIVFHNFACVLLQILFVLRVFHGVVPEVEAFTLMDDAAHPLAKVCIAYFAESLRVFVNNKFFQVFKIEFFILSAKISQDVLHRYKSIIVSVEVKECFPYADPIVLEPFFN
jgi:hypothetical protein